MAPQARAVVILPAGGWVYSGFGSPAICVPECVDRIQSVGGQSYSVDANGNLTAFPGATLAYDQANRLKTATISGTTTTYVYDGDGKRASKIVGSTATTYAYDANRSLPVMLTDGTLKYVWGNGLAYATDLSGTVQEVYHTDGLGSVRAITNAAGSLVQGTALWSFASSFGSTGEQRNAENSTDFLHARRCFLSPGRVN